MVVNWVTASEINNNYFDVERCEDGISFVKIGNVQGAGNSNETKMYSLIDKKPDPKNYYRLKQVDFDGKYTYSGIIALSKQNKNDNLSVYPNPATNELNFYLNVLNSSTPVKISLINSQGKEIYKNQFQPSIIGSVSEAIMLPKEVSEGVYLLVAKNADNYFYKKVIILH